jgi:hypothetical protein
MGALFLAAFGLPQFPRDSMPEDSRINNTNPILDESSDERRTAREAGFEIAYDGMEVTL